MLMILIGTAYGMFEYTKRYSFCKGCHEMNQAHDTWMSSKHGPILGEIDSCMACHAEEGALGYIKAKLSGIKSVYYHITGQITGHYLEVVRGTKPVYCTKSGCHSINDLDLGLKINVNHEFHARMGFNCVSCHDRIAHGWDEGLRTTPNMQETCFNCHDNKIATHEDCGMCHVYQDNLLKGIGGIGVDESPSPHAEELQCKDCHTHACAPDLTNCSACHDEDIVDDVGALQVRVSLELESLRGTFKQLERIFDIYSSMDIPDYELMLEDKMRLYSDAKENYEYILKDLSRGFHNFEYVWHMLEVSKVKADRAISEFSSCDHTLGIPLSRISRMRRQ